MYHQKLENDYYNLALLHKIRYDTRGTN